MLTKESFGVFVFFVIVIRLVDRPSLLTIVSEAFITFAERTKAGVHKNQKKYFGNNWAFSLIRSAKHESRH